MANSGAGIVSGFLSLFKGDSVGEIAAKAAGIVAASTITYGAADRLAERAIDGVDGAINVLVDTPVEGNSIDRLIFEYAPPPRGDSAHHFAQ